MTPQAEFEAAVALSKKLDQRPSSSDLLRLYALYKQATEGDVATERPGATDFVARAKWDAWSALTGTTSEQAMRDYTALVETLHGKS